MKLSWQTTIGLVLLGLAGMLAWTHFDQAARLKSGKWLRVQAQVLEVSVAHSVRRGAIAVLRWTGEDGAANDGGAYITLDDFKAKRFKAGDTVSAWVHPGFSRPELAEAQPNLEPDQEFTGVAALACAILGAALLAFAFATGRVLATGSSS